MKDPRKTPLETWIAKKIGFKNSQDLLVDSLRRYQLNKLNETIDYANQNSSFYERLFSRHSLRSLPDLGQLSRLPFTSADDIRRDPMRFLCGSHDSIARVVTLRTTGTTTHPKRIFFTDSDLESTVDFFHHGMSTLVKAGEKVLILMPGELPGSVGDLLLKGLARMGVRGFVHWPVQSCSVVIEEILQKKIDCLVGIPAQVMSLVRSAKGASMGPGIIKNVLLSADYVPKAVVAELERVWRCRVFQHYGMTESGLGGGVECEARKGYHLREADLYYEIVDPEDGRSVPHGEFGEVVFTTLTRKGMPLIRYRTGDLSSFVPEPCPCGSMLRCMSPVRGRIGAGVNLRGSPGISMPNLDEVVFSVSDVMNYQAEIINVKNQDHLRIKIFTKAGNSAQISAEIHEAVTAIPAVRHAIEARVLRFDNVDFGPVGRPKNSAVKRKIIDRR